MKQSPTIIHACQVLRSRVAYKTAGLRLKKSSLMNTERDTKAIQQATERYRNSWIDPIIDAIETGDLKMLKDLTELESGTHIES